MAEQGAGRGTMGAEAGPAGGGGGGRPGATPGGMFCSPGVDTWQAKSPASLCKAHGCFFWNSEQSLELGRKLCLPDQPGKVAGGASSRLLPLGARGMSNRISSGQLSSRRQQSAEHPELRFRLPLPLPSRVLSGS